MLAGARAGLAGSVSYLRLGSGAPPSGAGAELDAIAAVVIGGVALSGGIGRMAGTALGALLLTRSASSAPLADAWPGLNQKFTQLAQQVVRYFPAGGPGTRITGTQFTESVTVTGAWVTDATPILTIQTPAGSPRTKWRAVAYDRLTGNTWSWSQKAEVSVGASDGLLAGTRDAPLDTVSYVTAMGFAILFLIGGIFSFMGLPIVALK
mgnify:CR=1 FL=1